MKLALIGLANAGKTTLFNALTGQKLETPVYATTSAEPNLGSVKVPDRRVEELVKVFKPKKTVHATVDYLDFLGLTKGDMDQNRKVFDLAKEADALVHILRGFEDESVAHPMTTVDPVRDYDTGLSEQIFGDFDLADKRLARMEEAQKKGKKSDEAEKKVMLKCREILEKETPLRHAAFDAEEEKALRHLQFISMLPEIVVLNVGENDLKSEKVAAWTAALAERMQKHTPGAAPIVLSGKIEMELTELSPEDAAEFLKELGITEPASHRLVSESYGMLGYISFLTVGPDEVRAWTIREGTVAQKAAGKVHSDIERGFIRAEVVHYDDFMSDGSYAAARSAGHLRLEGKTYIVKDGDLIEFRFNV
jgi:ribosome-binding ATPase